MKPVDLEAVALLVLLEDVSAQAPDAAEGNARAAERKIRQPPYREWPYHSSGSQQNIVESPRATRLPVHDIPQPLTEGNLSREGLLLGPHEDMIERVAQNVFDDASPASSGYGDIGISGNISNTLMDGGLESKGADSTEEIFPPAQGEEGNMTPFLPTLVAADGEVLRPARKTQGRGSPDNPSAFEGAASRKEAEVQASEPTGKDTGRHAESVGAPGGLPKSSHGEERARRRRAMRQEREQLELGRRIAALEEMVQESSGQHLVHNERPSPRLSYPA